MELIGREVKGPYEAAKQAYIDHWEGYWELASRFHQNPKSQPVAEPDLPRITVPIVTTISAAPCSINGRERDLPGPRSQDDDEDSSPYVQDLNSADHVPCSSSTMTTSGHNDKTLTHSLGASAHGSEFPFAPNANLTGSDRKVTPASPRLTAASEKTEGDGGRRKTE